MTQKMCFCGIYDLYSAKCSQLSFPMQNAAQDKGRPTSQISISQIAIHNNSICQSRMFPKKPQQDKASCPFNPNHLFAKQKFVFHLNRCKDRQKVAHLFSTCRYNGLHYLKKQDLAAHETGCPDRQEVDSMMAVLRKNYDLIARERSRSRDRRKREVGEKCEMREEEEHTLSECEDCIEALGSIEIEKYGKLKKYLLRYQELKREER